MMKALLLRVTFLKRQLPFKFSLGKTGQENRRPGTPQVKCTQRPLLKDQRTLGAYIDLG